PPVASAAAARSNTEREGRQVSFSRELVRAMCQRSHQLAAKRKPPPGGGTLMGGDAIAALGRATLNGHMLFGHNCRRAADELLEFGHIAGHSHAPEEKVETCRLALPQVRETYMLLGVQTRGEWGLHHGVNDQGVAAGWTRPRTRLGREAPGLAGPDLVRLA